ncbi:hypothetical protein 9081_00168 [Pseudomonas phage bmx-p3]|nr:hypothetical protein 9081_00168 [Pseudomonas phage bmx-p3]
MVLPSRIAWLVWVHYGALFGPRQALNPHLSVFFHLAFCGSHNHSHGGIFGPVGDHFAGTVTVDCPHRADDIIRAVALAEADDIFIGGLQAVRDFLDIGRLFHYPLAIAAIFHAHGEASTDCTHYCRHHYCFFSPNALLDQFTRFDILDECCTIVLAYTRLAVGVTQGDAEQGGVGQASARGLVHAGDVVGVCESVHWLVHGGSPVCGLSCLRAILQEWPKLSTFFSVPIHQTGYVFNFFLSEEIPHLVQNILTSHVSVKGLSAISIVAEFSTELLESVAARFRVPDKAGQDTGSLRCYSLDVTFFPLHPHQDVRGQTADVGGHGNRGFAMPDACAEFSI